MVVTIIVLIILAGISINLILGDNGIITKAMDAKQAKEKAELIEHLQLKIATKETEKLQNTERITQSEIEEILSEYGTVNKEGETIKGLTPTDKDYEIPFEEIYSGSLGTNKPEGPTYTSYTRGQELTIGTETFYVLEDSDESKETVILFAKYNLNEEATAQAPNANDEDTGCVFSTSNYWSEEDLNVTPKFNLNKYEAVIEDTGSAVYKAKSYATTVFPENIEDVEGRLLTYEEAIALEEAIETDETGKIAEMLWGQANTQGDANYLLYWVGSVDVSDYVWIVFGDSEKMNSDRFEYDFGYRDYSGVRPVIEVSKSAI